MRAEIELYPAELSAKPESLGYLASAFIQIPQIQKQALLETDSPSTLLRELLKLYRTEVNLMRFMPKSDQGIFSFN